MKDFILASLAIVGNAYVIISQIKAASKIKCGNCGNAWTCPRGCWWPKGQAPQ